MAKHQRSARRPHLVPDDAGSPPAVSVVVPAYNESPSLPLLLQRLEDVFHRIGSSHEFIVVDDGSDDGSRELLRRLAEQHEPLRVRVLDGRHGKSAALEVGLRAARGARIVLMDADLQDLPEEIPTLLAGLEHADVVQAWRQTRNDVAFKRFASWCFNAMCSGFSGLRLRDVNCGFKALDRRAAQALRLGDDLHRFIPVLLHREGFAVVEVPVRHSRRAFGSSKYGLLRYFRGFSDLISVVLLPRLLRLLSPALGPLALLSLLGSGVFAALLVVFAGLGQLGMLWEFALSSLGLLVAGLLALSLSLLARTDLASRQADRAARPRVAERIR